MKGILSWVGKNADGALALALAAVVAVITWLDVASAEATNGATLLVLGMLAAVMLRERSRLDTVEHQLQELTETTQTSHDGFDDRLATIDGNLAERLTAIKTSLDGSREALENLPMVRSITGLEVNHALEEARQDTDRWFFKGGTGTYMRAVTLPECVRNAQKAKRTLLVRIDIIDPTNDEACDHYGRFRRSLPHHDDTEPWTTDRVRKESYATILAGLWWRQKYHLLDIDIGLSAVMTTLRWDLSESRLIITQEDPRSPALMIEHGRFFYDRLVLELRNSLAQARKVPLELVLDTKFSPRPTVDETQTFFGSLGLTLPAAFDADDVEEIVQKALEPKNPYES